MKITPVLSIAALSLSVLAAPAMAAQNAGAGSYPQRPIRVVIGFTPGGTPDITARLIGARLSEPGSLGQPIVVDNRPGAGGTIGGRIVAESEPDGYTLISVSSSHVLQLSLYARLPFDTTRDFAGITRTNIACYMMVTSMKAPFRNAKELITLAKSKPGQLNFASAGDGSGTHFAAEMVKSAAGIDVIHVPYKGIPAPLNDTIAGRVQFFMSPLSGAIPLVKASRLRALGVSCAERVAAIPDIPTLAETALPGFSYDTWSGILAPAKTPRAIINRLHDEIVRVLAMPEISEKMLSIGLKPAPLKPAEFDRMIAEQVKAMAKLARGAGIKPR